MKITLTVNGKIHRLDVQPMRRLLDVLRGDLGLTGTKEGCGEGECGACAVHIDGKLLNSCQIPVYQAHGRTVLTIEGLGTPETPDPLQKAFVEAGAVQCGFCTPGLLMASRALLNSHAAPTAGEIRAGLAGNLCRCTGYGRVVQAVQNAAGRETPIPPAPPGTFDPPVPSAGDDVHVVVPDSLAEALDLLAADEYTIIAGATDLMAAFHAGEPLPPRVLDVSRLPELAGITVAPGKAALGAAVSFTDLLEAPELADHWPALVKAARLVGAPAVRNAGTIGGNLVNASPGADLAPVLAALDGVAVIISRDGERKVPVTEFYRGYRECDLEPGELVKAVELLRPAADLRQEFFKAGTRRAQSIARVNLACCARVDARGTVSGVKLIAGSVGPTMVVLKKTMAWLEGRPAAREGLADEAGRLAAAEVAPIDDVRATAEYRRTVLGNLVARFVSLLRSPGNL